MAKMKCIHYAFTLIALIFALSGCISSESRIEQNPHWRLLLHDDFFTPPQTPLVNSDSIFALPSALNQEINNLLARQPSNETKGQFILTTLFGNKSVVADVGIEKANLTEFRYDNSNTTIAEVTYANARGNCISLSILAYAIANSVGLSPVVQEVEIPMQWQRIVNSDVVNRHVNVRIRKPLHSYQNAIDYSRDLIIDFYPTNYHRGISTRAVSKDELLAMFYSNLSAEALLKNELELAYANIKTALNYKPSFDAAWLNLAQIYLRKAKTSEAEAAIREGLRHNPNHYLLLFSLLHQLEAKHADSEAQKIRERIAQRQRNDPYYLYNEAMRAKNLGKPKQARDLLEKAISIAQGFELLHRELASIYQMLHQYKNAQEQTQLADEIAKLKTTERSNGYYWLEEY